MEKYQCEICGKKHTIYYGSSSPEPDYLHGLSEEERAKRVETLGYLFLIDKSFLIVKGTIFIEVKELSKWVYFEVWVRIEVEDFKKKLKEEENENYDIPLYGKIESELFFYENIKNLKVEVFFPTGGDNDRIQFEIAEENNTIYLDQKNGISKEKLISWMQKMNHPKPIKKDSKKESFQVRFKKIIKEAKTDYFAKQKSFIIDVGGGMILFQIVSPDILGLEKKKKGFVIYLPFDISNSDTETELEIFKKTKYFNKFEHEVFDEIPTYYLMIENEKRLIDLSTKIIKEVYEVENEAVEFDVFEP